VRTLIGHSDHVYSVAFSPSTEYLASASGDYTIKLWHVATGQCIDMLVGHTDWVSSVAFSPDSKYLISPSGDRTIKLWDTATRQCIQTLNGHSGPVDSATFSADSSRLVSASEDCMVKLWDVATGQCLQTFVGHSDKVRSVALFNATHLASASNDRTIKFWNTAAGECLQTFNVGCVLHSLAFDTTCSYLYTETGTFLLNPSQISNPMPSTTSILASSRQPRYIGYGISSDHEWITWNSENILWLPSEYRPVRSAVLGLTMALGCLSGRVLVFRFSEALW
jgi:WD40 repeat protein